MDSQMKKHILTNFLQDIMNQTFPMTVRSHGQVDFHALV